ncbi:tyrosine-type recombinase/integrase [Georgenia yuyongxinii]|uniref:Tyrosine-type recombinase/integrase n=1 Tax=Georgenia yuyongxinii TaxID=2589797 RepID=A0A552WNP6_9MICO|nr:tyrosine-type recombinase/integrase [Georgenia yuyongxinii]TRW44123.1 tyrosine-type recombinase/integrase [Georgenia yuyongxinii]
MAHDKLGPGEHGEIFIKRHKSGKFQARVRVRLFNGEETQISRNRKTGPAARLAVQAEIDTLLNAPRGSAQLKPDSRVGLAARQWIDELRRQSTWPNPPRRPQTVDEYERLLGTHLIPKLSKYRLNELTTAVCQDWVNSIIEAGRSGPYDMVVTAAQARGAFKAVLDRAIVHDALRYNPVDKTSTPKRKAPDPKAMTVMDVYRLRKAVRDWECARVGRPGPRPTGHLPAAIDLMLGTGLRIGEVLALNWGEVNLSRDGLPTITVDATLVDIKGHGTVRQEMPKTDAGKRTIIIPKFTVESLEAIRPSVTRPDMPVFPSRQLRDGRASLTPQTPHNVRRTLRAALELARMTGEVHPHLLRSTVATFVARERGMADAAALLGHKINGGVTARHYIERLRLAPDASAVLQAMVDIGEEEAGKATHRRTTGAAAARADAPAGSAEKVAVEVEDSGW